MFQLKVVQDTAFCCKGRVLVTAASVKLDDELKGRVGNLAAARRRTPHWIMREAIEHCVEREENARR